MPLPPRRDRCALPPQAAAEATTIPMKAVRGRASFLGDRSIGHMDPGARSSALMIAARAEFWSAHDEDQRQCRHRHRLALRRRRARARPRWCARWSATRCRSPSAAATPEGGLGTSVEAIMTAIDRRGRMPASPSSSISAAPKTNSEMAIEMQPPERQRPDRRLQRADRRGRGHGGDRGLRRRRRSRMSNAQPRSFRR